MKDLQIAIRKTLTFFDQFDYPLTAEELHARLWRYTCDLPYAAFLSALEECDGVSCKKSLFFLNGRLDIVRKRLDSIWLIEKNMTVAKKAVRILRFLPFLKAVFVCNTVALGWPNEQSDIDVFIVTRDKRVWFVRFFSTILLKLAGLRTNKHRHARKICLSFFASEDALDCSNFAIDDDVYLVYWLETLFPIYDPFGMHNAIVEKNLWAKTCLPQGLKVKQIVASASVGSSGFSRFVTKSKEWFFGGALGDFFEKTLYTLQRKKMEARLDTESSGILLTDEMIKLHDKREVFRDQWKKRYNTLPTYEH